MSKSQKIRVTQNMIINDTGLENISNFFCEFDKDGDPLYGVIGENPKVHPRQDGWWKGRSKLTFTVDLGAIYQITDIYFWNDLGDHEARVRMGTPFTWEYDNTVVSKKQQWCGFKNEYKTQFINFQFVNNDAPSEIIIYGYKVEDVDTSVPEAKAHPYVKLDKFVGINGFINDGDDVCRVADYIREYHPWGWNTKPQETKDAVYFNPSVNKFWDFDEYYRKMHSFGINVCPVYMGGGDVVKDMNADTTDPGSYMTYAGMIYQTVARYGSNKNVDPATIKVGEDQEKKIGLGYLDCIEILNEPNGTWLGKESYFTPFELAALLSICYDGHEGKYKNVGVKQADPNCKMSMSGLAGITTDYIKWMNFWAKYNRKDGRLPCDIINVHHYFTKTVDPEHDGVIIDANTAERGEWDGTIYKGISPDEGGVHRVLDELVDWRNRYYPEMEIWLTEFGWDTNQDYHTSMAAHAYGSYTPRQVQAMWLVREYLLLSEAGLERAAMFMSRDCGPEETAVGKFGSSGLIRYPIEIDPSNVIQGNKKDSFYYVYTLKGLLHDTTFDCEIPSGNKDMKIFKYKTDDGKAKYALWCVTENETKVDNFELKVGKGDFKLVEFINESYKGKQTDLENKNGTVCVNVSENPIFVVEK